MANNEITKIYEAFTEDDANRYLADGWVIVSVVSGTRIYGEREEIGPVYVLGKLKVAPDGLWSDKKTE